MWDIFAVFSHTNTYIIGQEYEASDQEQKRGIEKQKFALYNLKSSRISK